MLQLDLIIDLWMLALSTTQVLTNVVS